MGCGLHKGGQSTGPPWTSQWPAAGARPSGRLGHDGLLRRHRRQEGGAGTLAVGSSLAERQRGGLAAVESRARWRCSVCEVLRGEESWGVWYGEVEVGAALYRIVGGGEGRWPVRQRTVGGGAV
jgi:hypothetical protein